MKTYTKLLGLGSGYDDFWHTAQITVIKTSFIFPSNLFSETFTLEISQTQKIMNLASNCSLLQEVKCKTVAVF